MRGVYSALTALFCAALAVSSSAAAPHARIYSLKIGDRFDVIGTSINCTVRGAPSAARVPMVTCGLVRSSRNKLLLDGSYSFSFGDRGVTVFGSGAKHTVAFRTQSDPGVPLGDPAPADRSSKPVAVRLRPVTQGLEGVNVARTSVICVAVAYSKPNAPSLTCTLSSRAIAKALRKRRLTFRPITVTLSRQWLRVSRMSRAKTQRIVFSRRQPAG